MDYFIDKLFSRASKETRSIIKYCLYAFGIIISLVFVYFLGYIQRKGEYDFDNSISPLNYIENFFFLVKYISIKEIRISLGIFALAIVLTFFLGKKFREIFILSVRFFNKYIKRKELIYIDNFIENKDWHLRYWEESNSNKYINRIENSLMIFEAKQTDVSNRSGKFGACRDFYNLDEGTTYEFNCWIKSAIDTTMKLQLWFHDQITREHTDWRLREPINPITPFVYYHKISIRFKATSARAFRVHLEITPGEGKILVKKIKLYKILN